MVAPPFIIATFDWRYELPQFYLIPVAAVLGVMAMAGRDGDRSPSPAGGERETPSRSRPAETVPALRRRSDDVDAQDPADPTGA
jgi:hypothetical protein